VLGCSKATLQRILRGRVDPAIVINSDVWRGYNGLVYLGSGHFRVNYAKDEFARGRVHIKGIKGFCGLARVCLANFKGLLMYTFYLHLKEAEWQYNNRASDKPKILLRYLREKPLS
jgi:transposase-like protein